MRNCVSGMVVLAGVAACLCLLIGALPAEAAVEGAQGVDGSVRSATSVFAGSLADLRARKEAAEAYQARSYARYLRDGRIKREQRRARWNQVQAWFDRFPDGDYSDVLLVGDSIMDETRRELSEALPGCEINADSGRTLEEGGLIRENASPRLGVLDHIRNDDGTHVRYVIGTGNNDAMGMPISAAEEIIACLGSDKEIYFITQMVTANPVGTANTNATIDAMVAAYPNVHKIDWHGFLEGRESEFLRDVCHPSLNGRPAYAALLKAALDTCYAR